MSFLCSIHHGASGTADGLQPSGYRRQSLHTRPAAGWRRFPRSPPDADVYRGQLNGGLRSDGFARTAGTEIEQKSSTDTVQRLVPRAEQRGEGIFFMRIYLQIFIFEVDVKLLNIVKRLWYRLPCGGDYRG